MDIILKGDCISVMKAMKPNSVDAVVTDPPYGIGFMGKEWDNFKPSFIQKKMDSDKRPKTQIASQRRSNTAGTYDMSLRGKKGFYDWMCQISKEMFRVLKPGGSLLICGGTRTFHRLACAIEDSGFIIKDTLMWLYGSGFPKAQDLGKMIDKKMGKEREVIGINPNHRGESQYHNQFTKKLGQDGSISKPSTNLAKHWDGFKVGGIKPAYEPIIWAVKPPEGSYVDNVLKYGVGTVNVDETRISTNGNEINARKDKGNILEKRPSQVLSTKEGTDWNGQKGRFPSNIILSHHPECVQVGVKRVKNKGGIPNLHPKGNSKSAFTSQNHTSQRFYFDDDYYETVESWRCHPDCPVRMLDEQSGILKTGAMKANVANHGIWQENKWNNPEVKANSGGASRFFYCAKASRSERNRGLEGMEERQQPSTYGDIGPMEGNPRKPATGHIQKIKNNHPTVKPIALFEWLIKLVTRKGQIVLDPFLGSGTTAISAHNTGRKCVGIERENEYLEIAKKRVDYWKDQPRQMEIRI